MAAYQSHAGAAETEGSVAKSGEAIALEIVWCRLKGRP